MSKLKYQLRAILPLMSEEANHLRDREARQRYGLIKAVVNSKKSVAKACASLGWSTDSFQKWGKRLLAAKSLSALGSRSRRPKRSPNKTPKRKEKRVLALRRAEPYLGPERISNDLKRLFNMVCAPSTVYAILKRLGLISTVSKERLTKKHIKRYRRGLPGFAQLDVKYVPQMVEGKRLYQFNFVDHCTTWRFTRIYPSLEHGNVRAFLEELQATCPFPIIELQTDNGQEFTDKFTNGRLTPSGRHVLDQWCKEHSIRHKLIPVGQKELNGKVENTHKQDDREFYSQHVLKSLLHARTLILSYNERWNSLRHTKALGWKTPEQALEDAYVRMLAWTHLFQEKYQLNRNAIVRWDLDLNAFIKAPDPKKCRKRPSTRKRESAVNRYLKFEEWNRKKSS